MVIWRASIGNNFPEYAVVHDELLLRLVVLLYVVLLQQFALLSEHLLGRARYLLVLLLQRPVLLL